MSLRTRVELRFPNSLLLEYKCGCACVGSAVKVADSLTHHASFSEVFLFIYFFMGHSSGFLCLLNGSSAGHCLYGHFYPFIPGRLGTWSLSGHSWSADIQKEKAALWDWAVVRDLIQVSYFSDGVVMYPSSLLCSILTKKSREGCQNSMSLGCFKVCGCKSSNMELR